MWVISDCIKLVEQMQESGTARISLHIEDTSEENK